MSRSALSRLVCCLLLTILSALPLAAEPAGRVEPRAAGLTAGLSSLWSWLAGLWAENGCYIDPDGRRSPGPALPDSSDTGCYIDPNGGCRG